jgi:hypothetical protein
MPGHALRTVLSLLEALADKPPRKGGVLTSYLT